jgi:hypothetical protein
MHNKYGLSTSIRPDIDERQKEKEKYKVISPNI